MIAGARGRRDRVAMRDEDKGRVGWKDGRRQEVVPGRLLGDVVKVIA